MIKFLCMNFSILFLFFDIVRNAFHLNFYILCTVHKIFEYCVLYSLPVLLCGRKTSIRNISRVCFTTNHHTSHGLSGSTVENRVDDEMILFRSKSFTVSQDS